MLQWLRLIVWLLLCASVSGKEVQCEQVGNVNYCWNSPTHSFEYCLGCTIENQQITDPEVTIAPKHRNKTAAVVKYVRFIGGEVTKMPEVINKWINKKILNVKLERTKTRVLNAQFFGKSAQHLVNFMSYKNDNLSVEASAFWNCTALENLDLVGNRISSISTDAFRGLNKLVQLNLKDNILTAINENWFEDLANLEQLDLGSNQLTDVAETAFENLHKLQELHLQDNKIEIVTRRMFQHNQQLRTINLNNNQIKVIQSGSFLHLGKLSRLDLVGNDCTDSDFRNKNSEEISADLTACRPTICLIPVIPNGYIVSIEDNFTQTVGDSSEEYNPVKVVCLPTFSLFHERANQTANECQDEVWKEKIWAECHRE